MFTLKINNKIEKYKTAEELCKRLKGVKGKAHIECIENRKVRATFNLDFGKEGDER